MILMLFIVASKKHLFQNTSSTDRFLFWKLWNWFNHIRTESKEMLSTDNLWFLSVKLLSWKQACCRMGLRQIWSSVKGNDSWICIDYSLHSRHVKVVCDHQLFSIDYTFTDLIFPSQFQYKFGSLSLQRYQCLLQV